MAASTGNSLPSRRMAVISIRLLSTAPWPRASVCSRRWRYTSRKRGGMIVSATERPMRFVARPAENGLGLRIPIDDPSLASMPTKAS